MSSSHGTRAAIEAVATCAEPGAGSRALAVRAAQRALEAAGRRPEEIEMLVNAGVYRDENIIEPAMGPFIQRGIGANLSFPPIQGAGTFSFDLANGVCGLLTAIGVVDGFMRSGAVRSGMVVASDADPDPGGSDSFPFAAAGGAVLLRAASDAEGFAWFHARTWSEHFALYDARLCGTDDIADTIGPRASGQRLLVSQRAEFLDRCLECAGATVEEVVQRGLLDLAAVDLLIPAASIASFGAAGFGAALADRLGITGAAPAPAVETAPAVDTAPAAHTAPAVQAAPAAHTTPAVHTAATAFALERARADGSWARARRILFVSAGAGVTVSLALYEREPEAIFGSGG